MSTQVVETAPESPVDPLERLRSADSRPLLDQWREKVGSSLRASLNRSSVGRSQAVFRLAVAALCAMLVIAVGWRLTRVAAAPVEEMLPFAAGPADATPAPDAPAPNNVSENDPATDGVVVHVAGAVQMPGLVRGEAGWRVADAIDAASGPAPNADLDRINLAAPLRDGERIYVPLVGEDPPPAPSAALAGPVSGSIEQALVNLNSADASALQQLPGVGPATAQTIIDHRTQHGPFASVDALVAVRGIGAAKLDAIREYVTVG